MSLAGIFWRSSLLVSLTQLGTASTSKTLEEDQGMIEQQKQIFGLFQHTIPHPTIPGFYASSTSDPVPPLAKMDNEMDIDILIMPLHGNNANSGTDDGAIAPVNDFDHIPMVSPQHGYEDEDYGWNGQEGQEPDLESISQQYCGCHHESSETEGEDKEDKEDAEQYEKLSKCQSNGHGSGSPPPVVKPRESLGLFPTPPIVKRPKKRPRHYGEHTHCPYPIWVLHMGSSPNHMRASLRARLKQTLPVSTKRQWRHYSQRMRLARSGQGIDMSEGWVTSGSSALHRQTSGPGPMFPQYMSLLVPLDIAQKGMEIRWRNGKLVAIGDFLQVEDTE
ncbi:hypothetical protein B0H14DRAFT_2632742 [Mycena olivaceomarginata]|nr:hypothetical protein B0H14DRAFT_2632742 [Mycena olivaceomarginata]